METDLNLEIGTHAREPLATPVAAPVSNENSSQNTLVPRRAKSALRLKYEAETQVIQRKLGDLEAIRGKLGLSQRKLAQLLLVDPSAWTRWTKGEDQAPPHIYRMLQWYLALEEKYPVLDVNFWLNTVAQVPDKSGVYSERTRSLMTELEATRTRVDQLERQVARKDRTQRFWFSVVLVATALSGIAIGYIISR